MGRVTVIVAGRLTRSLGIMDPFQDPDYIAACEAQSNGDLSAARTNYERAASGGNVVALGELCCVCDQLGDLEAVRVHAQKLEAFALMSVEASYTAAKCLDNCVNTFGFEGAKGKFMKYLLNAAEIGNPIAELEVAANYWDGANGFKQSSDQARYWVRKARRSLAPDPLPDWAAEILET